MRVLLVEDDEAFSCSLQLRLKAEGFNVYGTSLGDEGLNLGKLFDYDVIILDLGLPDVSGMDVLRGLRYAKIETPILILTGNGEINDKVTCLNAGADDFVVKPCDPNELIARIRAIVRRVGGQVQNVITIGNIKVDISSRAVSVHDIPVPFTATEYDIFQLLLLRKGSAVSKAIIMDHLYGGLDEPEEKTIDVFICRVRQKLAGKNNGEHYIDTIHGRGYILSDPDPQSITAFVTPEEIKSLRFSEA